MSTLQEKTYSTTTLSTTNPTFTDLGANPTLCGEKPVTDRRSYVTVRSYLRLLHNKTKLLKKWLSQLLWPHIDLILYPFIYVSNVHTSIIHLIRFVLRLLKFIIGSRQHGLPLHMKTRTVPRMFEWVFDILKHTLHRVMVPKNLNRSLNSTV
jgi:hypothetical protein